MQRHGLEGVEMGVWCSDTAENEEYERMKGFQIAL
jgi:hypothetical protein